MRRKDSKHFPLRKLPLFVAVVGCLYGVTASAQTAQDEEEDETPTQQTQRTAELERVTVTGSLLRRVEYDSISPVQVIMADTSVAVGMVDTAEFLQRSSIASGSTQVGEQFSSAVLEGGTGVQTVNLRGLGANRTAVLLNGNRPGPAGTRGAVAAFDLNVIPSSIVQRVEILKDGSSSIYGSDALAGVANIITRKNIDRPEFSISSRTPFNLNGGEIYQVSGATGFNFDSGNIVLAAEYYRLEQLTAGARDYLKCAQDLVRDQNGNIIDREDRSTLVGTGLEGCNTTNLYANTVIDAVTGLRYVPTNQATVGLLPGYRPRANANYGPNNSGQAFYQDWLNFPFFEDIWIIPKNERYSVFASSSFSLGEVNWNSEFLYNKRKTNTHSLRQFFPLTGGTTAISPAYRYADGSTFSTPVPSGIAQPVMPYWLDQEIDIDYFYLNTSLDGLFRSTDTWSWNVNASYSRSSGDYNVLGIDKSKTGDLQFVDTAPVVDYYDLSRGYLDGSGIDELVAATSVWYKGNTVYDQLVLNAVVTGELFELPAGAVAAAFGAEYREASIDDQPHELEKTAAVWGISTAQETKGTEKVKEIFTEIEVPLLKGLPAVEALTLNVSARAFDYDSINESDHVWKVGLGWQIVPSFRLRATKGTSFRAPGLYELFLGDQSSFVSQTAGSGTDPCVQWGQSSNDFLRANCAAAGIPDNYNGNAVTFEAFKQGAGDVLEPETSRAFTAGMVWMPTFAPISLAVDYFSFEVNNQIADLTSAQILAGCYYAEVFPNYFCTRLERQPDDGTTSAHRINVVYPTYVNVDKQKVRGYDLLVRYEDDFSFGNLDVQGEFTYMTEDFARTFSATAVDGLATNDRNGAIGRPKLVGNLTARLKRGDFAYTWGMEYVGKSQRLTRMSPNTPAFADYALNEANYFGWTRAVYDTVAESRLYHSVSVRYEQPKWSLLVGVRNLFNAEPDTISSGVAGRFGNIPQNSTQYDLFGRSLFVRYNYKF
jgi:iron complex outermembrane recepter protein